MHNSKLGESYIDRDPLYEGKFKNPTHKIINPTIEQLANVPKEIIYACSILPHHPQTFFCLRHGDWLVNWTIVNDRVDWSNCQCPKCIEDDTYHCL